MAIMEQAIDKEFPLAPDLVYLNHAAVSPWPVRTARAIKRFADENVSQGSLNYPQWMNVEAELRQQCQQLINAPSADDIALLKNTSEALSVVAYGLQWQPGDNIVISDQEFPSNRIVWQSLQRYGVEVRTAHLDMKTRNSLCSSVAMRAPACLPSVPSNTPVAFVLIWSHSASFAVIMTSCSVSTPFSLSVQSAWMCRKSVRTL